MLSRLPLQLVVLFALVAVGSSYLANKHMVETVNEAIAEDLAVNASEVSTMLSDHLAEYKHDVAFLHSGLAATHIQERLLVANSSGETSFRGPSEFDTEELFKAFLASAPAFFQLRVILPSGQEYIRVERRGGRILLADKSELQNKADRDYVEQGLQLSKYETYVSSINLNEENGRVEVPYRPTVRIVKGIYSQSNQLEGLLVANADLSSLLAKVDDLISSDLHIIIADEHGTIIKHPDNSYLFAKQLGTNSHFFSLYDREPALESRGIEHFKNVSDPVDQFVGKASRFQLDASHFIVAVVGKSDDEINALYTQSALKVYSGLGFVLVSFAGMFLLLFRNMKHHQALAESRAVSHAVVENSNDAILLFNRKYRLLDINPAAERLFNESRTTLLAEPLDKAFNQYASMTLCDIHNRAKAARYNSEIDIEWRDDISIRYFRCVLIPLQAKENAGQFVLLLNDVTAIKKYAAELAVSNRQLEDAVSERTHELELALAEVKQANVVKTRFISSISHEMRTPLNGILGAMSILKRDHGNKGISDIIGMAEVSTNSLAMLVNDILDLSKIEAGKLDINLTMFSPEKLLEGVCQSQAVMAFAKDIDFFIDTSALNVSQLKSDPFRITQILNNLVGNAIKFTRKGAVQVIAKTSQEENDDGVKLVVTVKDSGIGIKEDAQQALFTIFTQADRSIAANYGGSGLGLAICKQLCELLGGDISLKSVVGLGTEVTFSIPADEFVRVPAARASRLKNEQIGLLLMNEAEQDHLTACLVSFGASVQVLNEKMALPELQNDLSVLIDLDAANAEHVVQSFIELQPPANKSKMKLYGLSRTGYTFAAKGMPLSPLRKPLMVSSLLSALADQRSSDFPILANTRRDSDRKRNRASDASHFNHQTVLIVDDNNINQDVVMHMLAGFDLNLLFAEHGQAALEVLKERSEKGERIDLILMDCNMPVMDGFACTHAIRNGKGGLHVMKVPIIAMTANAMKGERDRCIDAGMDDYITKPVEADILTDKLTLWINRDLKKTSSAKLIENREGKEALIIWDRKDALQRLAGNETLLKKIVKMLLESLDERLSAIEDAINDEDSEMLRQQSHKLKGSVGEIGAKTLHKLLQSLEHPPSEQDNHEVFNQILQDSEALRKELTQYLAA
ncbi:response regulator [Aestuariibacter sp. GS-14]|uniref:ATP-binding protein n=1 Tax=Aestuariibacter sp. GS-14 TaxID=2590670 RepID=UPI0011279375|nr:ATP-binding protein [Aestuariibacter sp. GS-14]TPV57976.1 response regulator [Aestuariibacter sp. GS-14]